MEVGQGGRSGGARGGLVDVTTSPLESAGEAGG